MKSCPYCDGQLMDAVVRCVHCGKDLNTPEASALIARKAEDTPSSFPGAPGVPGAAANPLAAAAALPVAGGPPSINQPPFEEPEPDFSDQPQYFVMKTEMTPPGAARPVSTKARASVSSGNGIATLSAVLAVVAAIILFAALFLVPAVTATIGGTLDMGVKFGQLTVPDSTETMKVWDGGGWGRFVLAGFAFALLAGGLGYLIQREDKALRGFILLDGVVVTGVVFLIAQILNDEFENVENIMLEASQTVVTAELGRGLSGAEIDRISRGLADIMTATKGPAITALWVGAGLAVVAGVLGLMIKKEPKMPTMVSAPPPPNAPPPSAPPPNSPPTTG